jgi:hypothetical protein
MFQNFKNMMLDRKLVLFDDPIPDGEEHSAHIAELLELQAEVVSKYIIKVEAPNVTGKHDDMSDAMIRMVWCATANATKVAVFAGTRGISATGPGRFGRAPSTSRNRGAGSHESRTIPKGGRKR